MDKPYNPFTPRMKHDEDVPNLGKTSALRPTRQNKLRASVLKSTFTLSFQCECEQVGPTAKAWSEDIISSKPCGDKCRNIPSSR